jgi:hypothetical protein
MSRTSRVLLGLGSLLALFVMAWLVALEWVRSPNLWIPIPAQWIQVLMELFEVRGQEEIALLEFGVYVVPSFAILVLAPFIILWLIRRRARAETMNED